MLGCKELDFTYLSIQGTLKNLTRRGYLFIHLYRFSTFKLTEMIDGFLFCKIKLSIWPLQIFIQVDDST